MWSEERDCRQFIWRRAGYRGREDVWEHGKDAPTVRGERWHLDHLPKPRKSWSERVTGVTSK